MKNKELQSWIDSKRQGEYNVIDSCGDVEKDKINQADIKLMSRARLALLEQMERELANEE